MSDPTQMDPSVISPTSPLVVQVTMPNGASFRASVDVASPLTHVALAEALADAAVQLAAWLPLQPSAGVAPEG